jgi:hypothetical protein
MTLGTSQFIPAAPRSRRTAILVAYLSNRGRQQLALCGFSAMPPSSLVINRFPYCSLMDTRRRKIRL